MDKIVFLVTFVNDWVTDVLTVRRDYSPKECHNLREGLRILAEEFRFISPAPDNFSKGWKASCGLDPASLAFVKESEDASVKYVLVLADHVIDAMNKAILSQR